MKKQHLSFTLDGTVVRCPLGEIDLTDNLSILAVFRLFINSPTLEVSEEAIAQALGDPRIALRLLATTRRLAAQYFSPHPRTPIAWLTHHPALRSWSLYEFEHTDFPKSSLADWWNVDAA